MIQINDGHDAIRKNSNGPSTGVLFGKSLRERRPVGVRRGNAGGGIMKEPVARPRGSRYRVRFCRTLVNDSGVICKSTIDVVDIRAARSTERALSAAMRRFERKHRIAAWHDLAHSYETEEVRSP